MTHLYLMQTNSLVFQEELGEPLTSAKLCSAIKNTTISETLLRSLLESGVLPDSTVFSTLVKIDRIDLLPLLVSYGFDVYSVSKRVSSSLCHNDQKAFYLF